MLRRAIISGGNCGGSLYQQCRKLSQRSSAATVSSAVNSMLLRSLKEHYLEVSNMSPPPKVSPPSNFSIVKGAIESNGPVLKRHYNNEEISISVMRLANIIEEDVDDDNDNDNDDGRINQLFVHIDVSKPSNNRSLNFLCGLYPDALGIHSVSLRPKSDQGIVFAPNNFTGPLFETLDEKTRDAFHNYIEERGINETLFPFLQAWLYVKDHRNLMRWFQTVGLCVSGREAVKEIDQPKGAANANGPRVARGT
ncbi:hypothetical protein KSS87_003330 [Heliosperma pusillum]|nr:hypothetical protein KSS87_005144 [Heliosperma pusillum]KAH9616924.1 hypothetical protein KSS87_003330 [Heliosperma pusillum]